MLQSFFNVALIATAILSIMTVAAGVSCARCYGRRRPMAGTFRLLLTVLFAAMALSSAFLALGVVGYQRLTAETEIAHLSVRKVDGDRYYVQLRDATGLTRGYGLEGEQWQLEARVITWRGPARLAGFTPLYRIERISGRWSKAATQRESPSTAHDLPEPFIDLWSTKRRLPELLRFVQADYGSGAYLPLIDGARYRVTLSTAGGLVAYPADEATAELMRKGGW